MLPTAEHSGSAVAPRPPEDAAGRAGAPRTPTSDSIAALCAAHAPVQSAGRFPSGTIFGDWRLTAFIGCGGNGEVYCAEHVTIGTPAAVKVLVRDEERAKIRFEREAKLLAKLKSAAFPRFFAYGEAKGTAYLAMELLEPDELPTGDRAVAKFMLKVCEAVGELHALGYVHRDIKPSNILWRRDGRAACPHAAVPVLADLGLVKPTNSQPTNSQLKNNPTTLGGVGTPGYGAPEQMERGVTTPASDIHALGVLADRCFNGNPPRAWKRIIERATSSIPAHRYPSASAFARAIRMRNLFRALAGYGSGILFLALVVASVFAWRATDVVQLQATRVVQQQATNVVQQQATGVGVVQQRMTNVVQHRNDEEDTSEWRAMCERGEIASVEKAYEPYVSPKSGRKGFRRFYITNVVEGVVVRLSGKTVALEKPVSLKPGEYRIIGPGRLDADISGPTNVIVRLQDCVLNNITTLPYPKNGIRYVFEGGAYLNFARLKRGDPLNRNIKFSDKDGDALEFHGPLTREELNQKRRMDRARAWREEVERENSDSAKHYKINTRIY